MTTPVSKPAPLPGTRPYGARDEREAAERVHDMFTRIAPRYDLLNRVISFSLDQVWRRKTAKRFLPILRRPDARLLDICCGTGDLTFALERARDKVLGKSGAQDGAIVGVDFVQAMIDRARAKALQSRRSAQFITGDAMNLPFPDANFDLVTSAFGFRNLVNYENGLREIARVLRQGGEVGILDFCEPGNGPIGMLFRFYFRHILPRIGGTFSNRDDYDYLPSSVARFPSPPELVAMMERCGFTDARFQSLNFGSIILYTAHRS